MITYDFIIKHVMPFNAVIVMSTTVAAILDFLAPQAPYLAWASYILAALVLTAMMLEVLYQKSSVASNMWVTLFMGWLRAPPGPLWKSSAWQAITIIMLIALMLGQTSKAKADSGGIIASAAPNLRNVQILLLPKAKADSGEIIASAAPNLQNIQILLLSLQEDTQRIQAKLNTVETKVDSLKTSVQELEPVSPPSKKYDSPRDALRQGDYSYLREHVGNGEKLPNAIYEGINELALGLNKKRPDRIQLVELYMAYDSRVSSNADELYHGFFYLASLTYPYANFDAVTLKNIEKLEMWSAKNRPKLYGTRTASVFRDCRNNLLDYAYIADDQELANWLIQVKKFDPHKKRGCGFELPDHSNGMELPEPKPLWQISAQEIKNIILK